ncbi:MAG: FAD-binding and (Fe-S)-binding domain-containing protein [Brachybacterium sp.]|nr:FAD-binding and (Fe-S)-binding domain-containing protein [Brachybacterium sp.]
MTSPPVPALDTDVVARHALAHDASHVLLIPEAISTPRSEADVIAQLADARRARRPLTFRAGGTSLAGQAQSDSILADVRRHFRDIDVLDDGARVRVGPGAVLAQVNAHLRRYGRRLGPDPASEAACTIGGVIANNSSGMTAGITENSYRTLESLRMVLPSGTVVDTARPDADARLRAAEPELHAGLLRLRQRVHEDPDATQVITERFALKNTMGYGLNALLDFETPAEILAHLVIGSEGTLAFVSSAVFRTVEVPPHVATGLLTFPDLAAAMDALPGIVETGFAAVELLDARSLVVAQQLAQVPEEIRGVDVAGHAALLVEQSASSAEELAGHTAAADRLAAELPLASPFAMTTDPGRRSALWTVRKGLYAAVAGARPAGSTALLEDVAVPVARLGETCRDLQGLFDAHGYEESVIFGHAKDGNIHFLLNEHLEDTGGRFVRFTEEMVDLVLAMGGNLKAEHGTGRVMAPFVERQYGPALTGVMWEIKRLVDPHGILNPGVVLTEDPEAHHRDLKPVAEVEEEVDRCVECGYCEPVCPSRDLTLTPRQRIVLRRDAALAEQRGDTRTARAIRDRFTYDGVQTCAVDGMCAVACPVDINTGDLVRRLRAEDAGAADRAVWGTAGRHWEATTRGASTALGVAGKLPAALPRAATRAARRVLGAERVPDYRPELPRRGGPTRTPGRVGAADGPVVAVLFPACVGTMFGGTAADALSVLAERAGVALAVPESIGNLCCGTPFSSKGMTAAKRRMRSQVRTVLVEATAGGDGRPGRGERLPVVVDASSCTEGLLDALTGTDMEVMDATTFVRRALLDRLEVRSPVESVTIHPTCSTTHLGAAEDVRALAEAAAAEVVVPLAWGCCGYAGDRGLLHPELTASATAAEAAEVAERPTDWYVSSNRTCEMGMSAATGEPYRHVLDLLEVATR